jgi:hypothetical protein
VSFGPAYAISAASMRRDSPVINTITTWLPGTYSAIVPRYIAPFEARTTSGAVAVAGAGAAVGVGAATGAGAGAGACAAASAAGPSIEAPNPSEKTSTIRARNDIRTIIEAPPTRRSMEAISGPSSRDPVN